MQDRGYVESIEPSGTRTNETEITGRATETVRNRTRGSTPSIVHASRTLFGDLGEDPIGSAMMAFRSSLFERGLSERSVFVYVRAAWDVALFCERRGCDLENVDENTLEELLAGRGAHRRAQLITGLRAYWVFSGRDEIPELHTRREDRRYASKERKATVAPKGRGYPQRGWRSARGELRARLNRYREALLRGGLAERSVESYCNLAHRAERHFAREGGSLLAAAPDDLRGYMEGLPKSRSSRSGMRSALHRYFQAFDVEDPTWALRVPRKSPMVARPLTEDEIAALLEVARADRGRKGAAVLVGLYMGLRLSEIAQLRFEDFDGGWLRLVGKGDREAVLPVHPELWSVLELLERDGPFVFPGTGRPHACPATIWRWVKELAVAAGLEGVSTHRLRHTALSLANDVTGDLRAVQAFARHSDPETTAGYTAVTRQRLEKVRDAIAGALGAPRAPLAGDELGKLSVGYRELIETLEGEATWPSWDRLSSVLSKRADRWRLSVMDSGSLVWRHADGKRWARAERDRFDLWYDAYVWSVGGEGLSELIDSFERGDLLSLGMPRYYGPEDYDEDGGNESEGQEALA